MKFSNYLTQIADVSIYDARLGRWGSMDPLVNEYPSYSSYNYAANTPVMAKDPDGNRILFVNGHWFSNPITRLFTGPLGPKEKYWGKPFIERSQEYFDDWSIRFIDGSSRRGYDQSGQDRYNSGRAYAEMYFYELTKGMTEDEPFIVITHSEGSAYGAGVASYLIEKGKKVETVLHLSPDEGDEFTTPSQPTTYEIKYNGDWVIGKHIMDGLDKSGTVIRNDLNWTKVHGTTATPYVYKELDDLKSVSTVEYLDKNGGAFYKQTETNNGTQFHQIDNKTICHEECDNDE